MTTREGGLDVKFNAYRGASIRQEFLNSKLGVRESLGGDFLSKGGEVLALISPLREGGR